MAKNFFKRYIWLVDLLSRRGYIPLKEISEEWRKSPLNDTHDPLSERTFFNHKEAILDIFGIEIKNDRSLGFYIATPISKAAQQHSGCSIPSVSTMSCRRMPT